MRCSIAYFRVCNGAGACRAVGTAWCGGRRAAARTSLRRTSRAIAAEASVRGVLTGNQRWHQLLQGHPISELTARAVTPAIRQRVGSDGARVEVPGGALD